MQFQNDNHKPSNYRKTFDEEHASLNSVVIVRGVLIPGFIGVIVAVIIGRVIPAVMQSMTLGHSFKGIGNNIVRVLDSEFENLTKITILENAFLWIMVFGFIGGIIIRHFYTDEKVK
jgi:hypothetical protein